VHIIGVGRFPKGGFPMATLLGDTRIDSPRRIQRFLNHPSAEAWDEIHGILITPHTAVWQAMDVYNWRREDS
jgi:hypothetical protein